MRIFKAFLPLNKLSFILPTGYYAPYCLSAFEIPNGTKPFFDERQKSIFIKFVQLKRKNQPLISINKCAIEFIKEKKIKYVIIEKNAITPKYLYSYAKLLNQYDGYIIFKMNQNKN